MDSIPFSLFSGDQAWIAPWAIKVISQIKDGQNPYDVMIPALRGALYPTSDKAFKPQLWMLMGVFAVSAAIISAGLFLRLRQGRLWILHRIDSTVLIPNISVCYGLCALVYAALGMVSIVDAVRVADGAEYPVHYVALQGVWPIVLWLGLYSEIWATFSAYYIRKYGAFHDSESRVKLVLATVLPFVFPIIAIVPSAVLFSLATHEFNQAFSRFKVISVQLDTFKAAWEPKDGLDLANLTGIIPDVAEMARKVVDYNWYATRAFIYTSVVLFVTVVIYATGAYLEISHLKKQSAKLKSQAALSPTARRPMSPQLDRKVAQQLDEEWFAGVRRQATLLDWASTNRSWTAALILLMLLESAGMMLWYGLAPLSLVANVVKFQAQILVACYMNGILSTLVSLLILFRSLDGSNASAKRLQELFPWLPLPPAVGLRNETTQQRTTTFGGDGEKSGVQVASPAPVWTSPYNGASTLMVQLEYAEDEPRVQLEKAEQGSSAGSSTVV